MGRKKILISIDWFLPGTKSGGPVRSYANLIEHLQDDFEFYIITRNTDFESIEPYEAITPNIWTNFNNYTKIFYLSADQLGKKYLAKIFQDIEFDVAYINGIYSWYFSILPIILLKKHDKPIIISARGMLNPQAFSVKPFKKHVFLAWAKIFGLYKNVQYHATNQDEAGFIKQIIGASTKVKVAPNLPRKLDKTIQPKLSKQQPVRFVNLARISIEKGTFKMISALRHIKQPMILDLYGPIYDSAYWEKCKKELNNLPKTIAVNYQGIVESDQVPQVLAKYDFFILLSEGENFGHAILEGLSAGLPVLISKQTPWKNLSEQQVGWNIDIKNESKIVGAFQKAINMDNKMYQEWSKAAYDYARAFIENPKVLEQNKALFLIAHKAIG